MPALPDYEIYQRNMILNRHGFPQFSADPEGNSTLNQVDGVRTITIGDIGYMEEGRFHRQKTLNLAEVLGEEPQICETIVEFRRPELAGSVTLLGLGVEATAAADGVPVGGSIEWELKFKRGESAVLNMESGRAIFRYCDKDTRLRLGEYMSENYESWLTERGLTRIRPRELILVTGTYMTTNWEAATLKESLTTFSARVSIELMNTSSFRIDWSRWRNSNQGFKSGHHHLESALSSPMTPPSKSFENCCHDCPRMPENQCIFLRGWRVREDSFPIPLEGPIPASWWKMLPSDIKRRLFTPTSDRGRSSGTQTSSSSGTQSSSSNERSARGSSGSEEEVEAASDDEMDILDIYDIVAIALAEKDEETSVSDGPIMVHDNDVIEFLESLGELESETGIRQSASDEERSINNPVPSSPYSDPGPQSIHSSPVSLEQEPASRLADKKFRRSLAIRVLRDAVYNSVLRERRSPSDGDPSHTELLYQAAELLKRQSERIRELESSQKSGSNRPQQQKNQETKSHKRSESNHHEKGAEVIQELGPSPNSISRHRGRRASRSSIFKRGSRNIARNSESQPSPNPISDSSNGQVARQRSRPVYHPRGQPIPRCTVQ